MTVGIDYEKVVDGLERCFKYETAMSSGLICEECPYNKENGLGTCSALLLKEALELIKEQEPIGIKTGKWITRLRHEHYPSGKPYEEDFCSECGKRGSLEYPFCPWCGIKMEGSEMG